MADDTEKIRVQVQDRGLVCAIRAHGKGTPTEHALLS